VEVILQVIVGEHAYGREISNMLVDEESQSLGIHKHQAISESRSHTDVADRTHTCLRTSIRAWFDLSFGYFEKIVSSKG
jgi:hypothetical protein